MAPLNSLLMSFLLHPEGFTLYILAADKKEKKTQGAIYKEQLCVCREKLCCVTLLEHTLLEQDLACNDILIILAKQ